MATFTATKTSEATVAHPRDLVWAVLSDPDAIARLTPMVRSIDATGDRWRWNLVSIPVLGQSFDLSFTEAMDFAPPARITFRHEPEGSERAGTDGRYDVSEDGPDATHLRIELTVSVDLPFPRIARPAVETTMHGVLTAMGAGFGRAIEKELRSRAA